MVQLGCKYNIASTCTRLGLGLLVHLLADLSVSFVAIFDKPATERGIAVVESSTVSSTQPLSPQSQLRQHTSADSRTKSTPTTAYDLLGVTYRASRREIEQ